MSELETKLRNLAARGELTHVSLVPVAGTGEYGVTFVAQVAPASRFGHVEGRDPDPVTALVNALDALPTLAAGGEQTGTASELIQTLRAAEREASDLNDEYVSTEHILLALAQGDGLSLIHI